MIYRKLIKYIFIIEVVLFTIIINNNLVFSQLKGLSDGEEAKSLKSETQNKIGLDKLLSSDAAPVGNIIDAQQYLIGPGDILAIQNLNFSLMTDYIIITPDCAALAPRSGIINLKGMTLAQAKDTILKKIKENNPNALTYITLFQPRTIMISVKGAGVYTGAYTLPASYRISTLMLLVNKDGGLKDLPLAQSSSYASSRERNAYFERKYQNSEIPILTSYSNRNIYIVHKDGTNKVVDLDKAAAYQMLEFDPYIREGDEINIPFKPDLSFPTIGISGAVIRPYSTVYKDGDRISLLLKLSLGPKSNIDLNNIKLFYPDNTQLQIKVDSNFNIIGDDIELLPGSVVIAGRKHELQNKKTATVSIIGNVQNPGVYPIIINKTRLKDAIEIAGGFTDEAYLPLAYIIRKPALDKDQLSSTIPFIEKFHFSDLSMQDTARFKMDVDYTLPKVSCDFNAAFKNNIDDQNVYIEDGDYIVVPSNPGTVYIYGQVNRPGFVRFEPGKDFDWYIEKAGGYAVGAKKGRVRIIRGRTNVWLNADKDAIIYAGDEIYIPRPEDNPPGTDIQTYAMIASLISSTVFFINVVYSILSKK